MTDAPIETDAASLIALGFSPKTYDVLDGTFYRRDTTVTSMPYLGQQVDDEWIFESSVICTEVMPDGKVQLSVVDGEYFEEAVPADSDEGQGVLRDSISGTLKP